MDAASDMVQRGGTDFACPTCGEALSAPGNAHELRCASGHSFNLAKEGHVHLLPPKRAKASAIAESDEIVRASRAFFEAGGFAMQATSVAEEVIRALSLSPPRPEGELPQVLGAGCGEGVYLRQVEAAMKAANRSAGLWGTDQSKLAVRYASKRQRAAARFAVVAPTRLPFAGGSMDVVLSAFAPAVGPVRDEFHRVLRPGGAVVVARAGSDHLQELRQLAGEEPWRPPKELTQGFGENYLRVRSQERYQGDTAVSLLEMTPFVRHAPAERRDAMHALAAGDGIETTVDVIISTHRVWLGTGGEPL